jgi:hypothetical protein
MDEKEYFEREAANEACREAVRRCPNSFYNGIEAARDAICHLPAADVRPVVKAKIVDMRYTEDGGEWKCSRCGWQYTLCICGKNVTSKICFCPNCGADMRGEQDV